MGVAPAALRRQVALEAFGEAELADGGGDVALVGVDGAIEAAHIFDGDFAGKIGER